jgi:parvulin-like peptidyl-prolyl isomerase
VLIQYEQAERLHDGEVSAPFETLSEVHVVKRVAQHAARTLPEVAAHVRELLARRRAREWIEKKIEDPDWVRIRWPLPERR